MGAESAITRGYAFHIDADGDWWSDGWLVDDPEMRDELSRALFGRAGGLWVRCADEVHPVTVEIAPLFVRDVDPDIGADGALRAVWVVLLDGRREPLRAGSLRVDSEDRLFCAASDVPLPALFFRPAFYRLMQHLTQRDDAFGLEIDAAWFPIRSG
jgi:hypothetical protein